MNNYWDNILKDFFTSTLPDEAKREVVDLIELNQRGREDICVFSEEMLGVPLNNFQRKFLQRSTTPRSLWMEKFGIEIEDIGGYLFGRNIACPSNQVGKTVMIAIKHLWFNYYKIGLDLEDNLIDKAHYQTLNISPHSRQVKQCYNYVKEILEERFIIDEEGKKRINKLHALMKDFLSGENSTLGELRFRNKSVFYTVPTGQDQAASLAGAQFGYISYDECAQCYSEDTEVLTDFGWKKFPDVKMGDFVPSMNVETGLVENVKVKRIINEPYEGDMIQFGGGRQQFTDLLVTPNHKMVVAKSKGASQYHPFAFEEAGNLVGKHFRLHQSFMATGNEMANFIIPAYQNKESGSGLYVRGERKIAIEDFLLFLGLYISEGSIWKNRIIISQTEKGKAFAMLPKLLDSMGYSWSINKKVGYNVFDKQLAEFVKQFIPGLAENKRIPREILNLSPRLLQILFDGLILGDGSYKKNGKGCGTYGTTSKGLVDDVMELCLRIGLVPSLNVQKARTGGFIKKRKITGSMDFYRVQFRKHRQFPSINHHPKNELCSSVKKVSYSGNIVCLTLEKNHTLMVRRNGRVAWSGNSLHLENELGAKIMSRLIKYGVALDLISTPEVDSPSHQYYLHIVKLGFAGKEGWWALNGILDDNKFIPKIQRDRAKADLLSTNKQKYRQVVFGDFISGGKKFFDPKEVEQMWRLSGKIACQPKHLYLLVSDWGMSDTGDESVFKVFDYTNWGISGKIQIVNHEAIRGGSPYMQFALLRTLYDGYTWYDDDGVTAHKPIFVMDAKALGGVVIKKLLALLQPRAFNIEKDEALMLLQKEMRFGRDYYESEVDGAVIEKNPNFGSISSYFIEELSEQLGTYHIEDKKLRQDFVMTLMMGVSYIAKKFPKQMVKKVELNHLAGYNTQVSQPSRTVRGNVVRVRQMFQ